MNQVYLSGIVADTPIRVGKTEEIAHSVFSLSVNHKTSKGEWRRELYTINSWYAAAQWVLQNLKQGQRVALLGYLTQRTLRSCDGVFVAVEVTSQEFLPLETKLLKMTDPLVIVGIEGSIVRQSLASKSAPLLGRCYNDG